MNEGAMQGKQMWNASFEKMGVLYHGYGMEWMNACVCVYVCVCVCDGKKMRGLDL